MQTYRLYSGWVTTLALLLIAWLVSSPGDTAPPARERTRASTEAPAEEASGPPGDVLLAGRIVILDPGHGGTDKSPGDFGTEGVGPAPEKEIVLDVARHLANLLRDAGAEVVMTRDDDVNPAQGTPYEAVPHGQLLARVAKAREAGGDVLISIHGDASADPAVHGTTTYYYHERSKDLARHLQTAVVQARGSRDLGVRRKGFMVVRDVPVPAALVEIGFLTNPDEARQLAEPGERRLIAQALFEGLRTYLGEKDGAEEEPSWTSER